MTHPEDFRLKGRHPEFARMSKKPGIGAGAMDEVASTLLEFGLEKGLDVPVSLRHGKYVLPLGTYLRRRLRERVGLPKEAPRATAEIIKATLSEVREAAKAFATDKIPRASMVKHLYLEKNKGKMDRIEYKEATGKRRGRGL